MHYDRNRINEYAPAARAGDRDAMEIVMVELYGYTTSAILQDRLFLHRYDQTDLIQEGMIGAMEAIGDWDPDRSPAFSAFAALCIRRNLAEALRCYNRKKHGFLNNAMSLDRSVGADNGVDTSFHDYTIAVDCGPAPADPANLVADDANAALLLELCQEGQTELEREVLAACLLRNKKYREVAADLGAPLKSIDNAIQRVRRKLAGRAAELCEDQRLSEYARSVLRRVAHRAHPKSEQHRRLWAKPGSVTA